VLRPTQQRLKQLGRPVRYCVGNVPDLVDVHGMLSFQQVEAAAVLRQEPVSGTHVLGLQDTLPPQMQGYELL
jgi:hypothetical protein